VDHVLKLRAAGKLFQTAPELRALGLGNASAGSLQIQRVFLAGADFFARVLAPLLFHLHGF
jgi:hypothetical protein